MQSNTRGKCCGQTIETGIVGRQPEAQQVIGPLKTAAPDVLPGQGPVARAGIGVLRQPKQRGAADNGEPGRDQHGVQFDGLRLKASRLRSAHARSSKADGRWPARRAGAGPRPERIATRRVMAAIRSQSKAQAGRSKIFRTSAGDHGQVAAQRHGAGRRSRSAKASSITSQPPRSRASAAMRASAAWPSNRPSGLLGLTSTTWRA